MAVEQSGADAAPESPPDAHDAQPTDAAGRAGDAAPSDRADFDELKRKFREALDRKHGAHASAEGAQDTGKVHGSHGPPVSRRSFRRKSGG
jgi:Family of unknown function (DUF5302)